MVAASVAGSPHTIVVETAFQFIGVLVLSVVAGMNEDMGKLAVLFMLGIVLGWFLINYSTFAGWIKKGSGG